eukprot:s643_g18.t2
MTCEYQSKDTEPHGVNSARCATPCAAAMLGRKREDLASKGGAKKRKKWQEESDEDDEPEEATVTAEEMEEWKAKMAEEEKQEERERQRREREQREEAERQERQRQKRIEEEERERKELEEQLEEEERERQNARRERAEKVAQEVKRLWDQPPVETSPSPVRTVPPRVVPVPVPPVAVATPPVPAMTPLMQAQAAGANIAASLMASHPVRNSLDLEFLCIAVIISVSISLQASGGRPGEEGDVTIHVQVPASRVKDLLGVQGRNIKAIKSQTGVMKVGVLDRNDPANVEIVGSPAAVEQCRALVQSVVDGDLTAIGNISETMDIDSRLISRLIGPKGQNISNMKDQSGAYLAVKEVSPGVNKVVITGFPDCVARGRELVVNFMNQDHSLMPTGHMPGQGLPPQMPNGMRPCGFGHQGEDGMPARMPVQGMPQNAWGPGPGKGFAKGPNQSPGWSNEWEGSWQGHWPAAAWPDQAWGKGKNNWNPSMGGAPGDFGKGGAFQPETWDWGNERQEANWAPMAPIGSPIGAPIGSAIGSSMGPGMAPAIGSPAADTTSWDDQQGPGWSQEWDPAWQQRWPQPPGFGGFSGTQNGAIGAGQAWNA